jgi:hypothetical protein
LPSKNVSSDVEELIARMRELERRVSALEHRGPMQPLPEEAREPPATADLVPSEGIPVEPRPSVFPVLGKVVLGIAGAYLLRAVAESGIVARWIVVMLALAYAAAWLVLAASSRAQARLARSAYAVTAALILSPLVWEATVRFRIIAPGVAAAALGAFALLAVILARRHNDSLVIWVGMLTAVANSLVLMVATRALVPFALALLVMALMSEFAARQGRWPALRPVVATAADFATFVVIVILGNSAAVPQDYQPVAVGILIALIVSLFVIYAGSLAIRSLAFRLEVTAFEAAQFLVAVLLVSWGAVRISQATGMLALGVSFLIAGAACYLAAFGLFARQRERRNFRFYSTCGVSFVMAGSLFTLPSLPLVIWFSLAAVIAIGAVVRRNSPALDLHGVAYLCGALSTSGLLEYASRALAGTYPALPGALPIPAAVAALLCAILISRYPGERKVERLLRLLPAILAVYAIAGFAVAGLAWFIARTATPAPPQLAVIRTVVTGGAALVFAFLGARLKRVELVWTGYAAAVLGIVELVFEELRISSAQSMAASLLIYGTVFILIPRLARAGTRSS